MPRMRASYGGEKGEQFCQKVQEGDHGLYLQNGYGEQIGYIPYDALDYVEPVEEDE